MIVNNNFDPHKYGFLLAQTLPAVIETEADNERMLEVVNQLMSKGEDQIAPEEQTLLRLLVKLIEDFEARAYRVEPGPPYLTLQRLMEARGVKPEQIIGYDGWADEARKLCADEKLNHERGFVTDCIQGGFEPPEITIRRTYRPFGEQIYSERTS